MSVPETNDRKKFNFLPGFPSKMFFISKKEIIRFIWTNFEKSLSFTNEKIESKIFYGKNSYHGLPATNKTFG